MSEKKNTPTPRRPRKASKPRRLSYREKGQRFIIAGAGIALAVTLAIGMLIGTQGTVAGSLPVAIPTSTLAPEASPTPSTSPSSQATISPQEALRFQAAAVALYLAAGVENSDPNISISTTTLPPKVKGGQKAPELTTPVSFLITEGDAQELVVCARAALPGSGLIDAYFIYPIQYEDDRGRRCPQVSPTESPKVQE